MVALCLLVTVLSHPAGAAKDDPEPIVVKDPHYGEVLFYFYQEDYFPAIVRLLAAENQQQLTEQLAFKGTMSALGCGVLLLIPPLLLLLGWLAELVGLPVAKYWPHLLLVLLAAFLGVQLIPKLLFAQPPDREQ